MMERKGVLIEVWPVVADAAGLWLASGHDAWRSGCLGPYATVHDEVIALLPLAARAIDLVHSTSWREDDGGNAVVLTYVVALSPAFNAALEEWPEALPIGLKTAAAGGPPILVGAAEQPQPRRLDVLWHALRHLRFLLDTDAEARAALVMPWPAHLRHLDPVLSGLYDPARR